MEENKFKYIYKKVGENIKALRKMRNLSQKSLALLVEPKMDRSKISDMENGKEDFTFSTLLRLCAALDVKLEDITKDIV